MIQGTAQLFDGQSAAAHSVTIKATEQILRLTRSTGETSDYLLTAISIDPPLGKTARRLRLPDGGLLETDDHALVTQLDNWKGNTRGLRLVHRLEQKWRLALLSLAGVVIFTLGFLKFGLPAIADKVARSIPLEATAPLTTQTLSMLDKHALTPTELSTETRERLQQIFRDLDRQYAPDIECRLVFRQGNELGANAFAFPDGLVLMTDELVEMADNDRQIAGVFLHEMAHVAHRHSLRSAFQSAGVFMVVSILTGDVTATTSLAATLPTVLLESGYSRGFESEADREAGEMMLLLGWGTQDYQEMLSKLTGDGREGAEVAKYLSTHPITEDRIHQIKQLEMQTDP